MPLDQILAHAPLNGVLSEGDLTSIPDELGSMLISIRRHLHRHPELGLHEYETARFIRDVLEMHGLSVTGPLARTGLFVDIEGAHPGPTVAYRADIDALPIQDRKTAPYASAVDGVAHLCGHDAHTSIAIGTALLLNAHRRSLHGRARVFFQPNEEGIPSGAPLMIRDGVLDGVEAVFASHVDPTLDVGTFGLAAGPVTASADRFSVVVSGPSTGHSARPHQSVDTVWVGTQIMNSIFQVVGRLTDSRNAAVIAICRVRAGDALNVIPASMEFGGTVRCIVDADRAEIKRRISDISNQVASIYGASVDFSFDDGAPSVVNDARLVNVVRRTLVEMPDRTKAFEIPRPSMGAEDFAHYLRRIPGALVRVGTASGPETRHVLHDSSFDVDERALPLAAQVMARTMIGYLNSRAA